MEYKVQNRQNKFQTIKIRLNNIKLSTDGAENFLEYNKKKS